jgi:hypothetical protein
VTTALLGYSEEVSQSKGAYSPSECALTPLIVYNSYFSTDAPGKRSIKLTRQYIGRGRNKERQ